MQSLTDAQIAEVVALVDVLSPEPSPDDFQIINEGEHIGCLHYRGKCLGKVTGGATSGGGGAVPAIVPRDGIDGKDGKDGRDGLDGINGKDGVDGKEGRDGIDGINGVDGTNGIDGENGRDGIDGIDGVDGEDGADGIDGANGTNGINGINGLSAYQVATLNGYTGTEAEWVVSLRGDDGEDGNTGLSAYQVAVANGYIGTQAQWVASLRGPAGTVAMYNQSGLVVGTPKVWTGYANPNSAGVWAVNFASAGFTTIPFVMVCAGSTSTARDQRNFASINTLATTSTSATGGVSSSISAGLLLATVLTDAPNTTPVIIMAIGV